MLFSEYIWQHRRAVWGGKTECFAFPLLTQVDWPSEREREREIIGFPRLLYAFHQKVSQIRLCRGGRGPDKSANRVGSEIRVTWEVEMTDETYWFPIFGIRARVRIESQLANIPSHGKEAKKRNEGRKRRRLESRISWLWTPPVFSSSFSSLSPPLSCEGKTRTDHVQSRAAATYYLYRNA